MLLGSRGSRLRCLLVWTAVTVAVGPVGLVAAGPLQRVPLGLGPLRRTPLDVALTDLAAVVLVASAVWLWTVTTIVVMTALRGTQATGRSSRGVPAGVRRVVLAACGVALAGGLSQPSYAAGPHVRAAHHRHHSALAGLPLPDRAVSSPDHPRRHHAPRTVRVRQGDSLWSLAAGDLPNGSPDAVIAARWRALYAVNRSLIGPDPDVIVPGQRLRLPGKDAS